MEAHDKNGYFPIAIIGIGCRMPGGVTSTEDFWEVLREGRDCITEVPADRWSLDKFHDKDQTKQGKMVSRKSGFIDNVDLFDNTFFKVSPKEAAAMDPQQRILLEVTHEAFEDAGIIPDELATCCGSFVGIGLMDYGIQTFDTSTLNAYTLTGVAHSVAANRLSYAFDLKGPSFAVDTACASSMTAMHLACSALWNRECGIAVLAGANALIIPETTVGFSALGVLSPDGKCCPFSDSAKGYVRSEGWGTLILKPLDQAIIDNDHIYASIIGTSVAANGHCHSLTMPSISAQQRIMVDTYKRFGVNMANVEYIEAHGTGTPVGDPIEAEAIGKAFCQHRKTPLKIGSVKSNFGHSECSAGVVAAIKVILMLSKGTLVPSINFENANPSIDLEALQLEVQTSMEPFSTKGKTTIGINSFGFAGALAHAILQEPPKHEYKAVKHPIGWSFGGDAKEGNPMIVPLSAKSAPALKDLASKWIDFASVEDAIRVIGWQATKRKHHECRLAVIANSGAEFKNKLEDFISSGGAEGVYTGSVYDSKHKVCFVFPGQGQQWSNMGRQLFNTEPVFRDIVKKCDEIFKQVSGWSLIYSKGLFNDSLEGDDNMVNEESINDMEISQPAIMFLQIGLFELWRHWGLEPDAVVGHSLGEVSAAYACGGLTLTEAVKVIYYRSKNQTIVKGAGSMAAVRLTKAEAEEVCSKHDDLYIAAENAPGSLTLAGSENTILNIANNNQIKSKQLRVQCAFHTPHMDPMEKPFRASMHNAVSTPAGTRTVPFFSTLTGELYEGDFKTEYWWNNIRNRVKFQPAIENIIGEVNADVFIECAASATLLSSVKQIAKGQGKTDLITVTSGQRQQDDRLSILNSIGQLYTNGLSVNWETLTHSERQWVDIPKYPWQHGSFWQECEEKSTRRLGRDDRTFKGQHGKLSLQVFPFLADHVVNEKVIFPGAGYVEYVLQSFFKDDECPAINNVNFKRVCTWPDNVDGSNGINIMLKCVKNGIHAEISSDSLVYSSCELQSSIGNIKENEVLDIADISGRCTVHQNKEQFYNRMSSVGLNYGQAFQVVDELMMGDGEVLGYLCPAEDNKQRIQTTQLDGCFQLLLSAPGETTTLYLPVVIDDVVMHVPKIPPFEQLIAYATITDCDSMMLTGDITMATKDGCILAKLYGVKCRNINGTKSDVDIFNCLYRTVWQPHSACMGETSILSDVFSVDHLEVYYPDELKYISKVQARVHNIKGICSSYIRNGLETVDSTKYKVHPLYLDCLNRISADTTVKHIPFKLVHAALDELDEHIPELKHELRMIRNLGDNFTTTLTDPGSAVKLLFRPECLPSYFMDSLTTRLFYKAGAEVVAKAVQKASEKKQVIRVLEIGGRMGGLTQHVLEPLKQLGEDKRLEYIFTDLSVTFFIHAQGTLEEYPFVKYQQLDIEKDIVSQGFVPGSIDLIICLDTIHSVVHIGESLSRVKDLLTDDGLFLMYEATNTHYISELVFGSLDLCWVFQDFRKHSCWLSRDGWTDSLERNGFVDVVSESTSGEFFHSVYLCRKASDSFNLKLKSPVKHQSKSAKQYTIIVDNVQDSFVDNVKKTLGRNVVCKTFRDVSTLDRYSAEETPHEITYVWSKADSNCHVLLKLLQLVDSNPDAFYKVWVVTSGSNMASPIVEGSKAIGLTRAVTNQCSTPIFSVDIDPDIPPATQAQLFVTYITDEDHLEREVVIRNDTYMYPRLTNFATPMKLSSVQTPFWQLTQNNTSILTSLDDLGVSYMTEMFPTPGNVLVLIKSTALNFKDVMMALGMLDALVKSNGKQFGLEFSGIVEKVGEGVTKFNVGDEVLGFGDHCFASHSICDADLIVKKPSNLSWDESAGVSIVYATSYHSLIERANLKEGETVLIHSACGGVGLSAIQVARMAGANIICTAGTQTKRRFLKETLGIENVTNSRSDIFYSDVMRWTNGQGVDVVLNSLHGGLLTKGIRCLAPGGRFCEIGKRDMLENSDLQMKLFLENKSFLSCQIDFMMDLQKTKAQKLLQKVSNLLERGTLRPIQFEVSSIADYQKVFSTTAKGSHIGKVIFNIPEVFQPPKLNPTFKLFKQNATYVITGGFGGIGLAMSRWLASKGAKHIVLVSRRGCRNSAGRRAIEFLKSNGVNVYVFAMDLSKEKNIKDLFDALNKANSPPIKGIFHLAGYIAEESLQDLVYSEADIILDSKATSAQLLHTYTTDYDLDIFFTLSSVTATWGHSSQPMYIAANNFVDALAEMRQAEGLPSLSVQLGVVRGAGYLEDKSGVAKTLAMKGHHSLHVNEILESLSALLQSPGVPAVVCLANQDWGKTQMFSYNESLKYKHLVTGDQVAKTDCSLSLEDIEHSVKEKMSKLLCVDPESIDINQPMINYGVDSLMAVEMVTWASKELNVVVSQLDILGGITTKVLLEKALNNDVVLPLKQE